MAKFRQVHTEFWSDPTVIEEMTPEDKYFFLYLLTNPLTTQIGIYQITKKQMAFDMGYSMETINALMDRFLKHHKNIIYNQNTREIAIKKWGKYNLNRGGKPMLDLITKELKRVKDTKLIAAVAPSIADVTIKDLFLRYGNVTYNDTLTIRSTLRGQEEEEEKEEEKEKEKRPKLKFEPLHLELAKLLFTEIQKNDPKAKEPNFNKWADDIRKLNKLDNRSEQEIREVIYFAQASDFWHSNILSANKLRKNFAKLYLQYKNRKGDKKHAKNKWKDNYAKYDFSKLNNL